MEKQLKDLLQSKKSDGKKKKGCVACKKKKVEPIELPDAIDIEDFYIPTREEIHLAYVELGNTVADKKEFIGKVYKALFDEEFNFACRSCVNAQARRLRNYIIEVLKIEI